MDSVGIQLKSSSGLVDNDKLQDPRSLSDLGYYFFIGQNTEGQWGVGASIWHIERVVIDAEGFIRGVFIENELLRFSSFDVKLSEWYRFKSHCTGRFVPNFCQRRTGTGVEGRSLS